MGYIFSIFRSVSLGGSFGTGTTESNMTNILNYQNDFPKTWDSPDVMRKFVSKDCV